MCVMGAMYAPSFISIGFMTLTFDLSIVGNYDIEKRMKIGLKIMMFNFAVLVFMIGWKICKIYTMIPVSHEYSVY